jgi:hypothetical protein
VNVRVNENQFKNLQVGEEFSEGDYKVTQITDPCATFQYIGQGSGQGKFTLCVK